MFDIFSERFTMNFATQPGGQRPPGGDEPPPEDETLPEPTPPK